MKPQSLYTSILLIIKLIKFHSNYAGLGFNSYMITVNYQLQKITAIE